VQEAAGSNPASPMVLLRVHATIRLFWPKWLSTAASIGPRPSSVAGARLAMPLELKVGDPAPEFRAQAIGGKYAAGQEVSLTDFRGSAVVLYFYPKDDTPGCTVQACGLRDAWDELSARATIFGVSVDSAASHEKFIKKYQLPFPLLSDTDKKIVDSYGVWVEKSMYGKKYMGAERSTFVIDHAGRISAIFRKVKPEEHVTILRQALRDAAR
jgi:peroxiredoxin Q/BCP